MILLDTFSLGIDENLKFVLIVIMAGVALAIIIPGYLKYRLEWKEIKLRYTKSVENEKTALEDARKAYINKMDLLSNESSDKKQYEGILKYLVNVITDEILLEELRKELQNLYKLK